MLPGWSRGRAPVIKDVMTRTGIGFVSAAAYNMGIILFSRGFSNTLGEVDPLFGTGGCIGVVLWGLAYLALYNRYAVAPAVALVFCVEKLYYAAHWVSWITTHGDELTALRASDPLSASFFGMYGVGDAAFMVFFGWVAWRHRAQLAGALPGE